jgi:hypothetical protein
MPASAAQVERIASKARVEIAFSRPRLTLGRASSPDNPRAPKDD